MEYLAPVLQMPLSTIMFPWLVLWNDKKAAVTGAFHKQEVLKSCWTASSLRDKILTSDMGSIGSSSQVNLYAQMFSKDHQCGAKEQHDNDCQNLQQAHSAYLIHRHRQGMWCFCAFCSLKMKWLDNRCRQDWCWVVQSCLTVEACIFKIRIYQAQTGHENAERSKKNAKQKSHHRRLVLGETCITCLQ